ncbi:hypothetical protein AMTR_s00011p00085350 [Amborella trichopoda]|uniref:Potassium channel domain-containing protein n=1 Tax=Amborella trichopoda TaxID=13333 RepID=W1NHD8_AMBTC|nr:hypothetical protein AMTR_s00011p00085350 [Amborella trichopoda]
MYEPLLVHTLHNSRKPFLNQKLSFRHPNKPEAPFSLLEDLPLRRIKTSPCVSPFPSLIDPYHLRTPPSLGQYPRPSSRPPSSSSSSFTVTFSEDLLRRKRKLHRSNSAPSLFTNAKENYHGLVDTPPTAGSSPSIVRQTFLGVAAYLLVGVTVYIWTKDGFKGNSTYSFVDALYFTMVTLCTIGYGDIVPCTAFTKLFTCLFILVGFGVIDILLTGLVTYVLDRQETVLLSAIDESRCNMMFQTYVVDVKKGRMRIRMKVGLALAVVVFCIAAGAIALHILEGLSWLDSFYLSVTSVTTVGYGDFTFRTLEGRAFAVVWLLVSTLVVARAFLYLTELRIDKRNRLIAKWILHKEMTVSDLVAADLDNDGSIRYHFPL